jgi:hypothetical protein
MLPPLSPLQLIRLCNNIHKRLGKHDVIQRARLLMLTANCASTFDRSGVNVTVSPWFEYHLMSPWLAGEPEIVNLPPVTCHAHGCAVWVQ